MKVFRTQLVEAKICRMNWGIFSKTSGYILALFEDKAEATLAVQTIWTDTIVEVIEVKVD